MIQVVLMEVKKMVNEKEKMKVGFGDLSNPLKTLVVFGWVVFGVECLVFGYNFILGVLGY